MKTNGLTDAQLDYWVERAEGAQPVSDYGRACLQRPGSCALMDAKKNPRHITTPDYSTSWALGGPIIEREKISAFVHAMYGWEARLYLPGEEIPHEGRGKTLLVAAMRAYVASKFGSEVSDEI